MLSVFSGLKQKMGFLWADPHLRNRLLGTFLLVFVVVFLIYFDIQQGFAGWDSINSKLSLFLAINVNIVLLVVLVYLLLKNILRLLYERNQRIAGVTLKTKLVIAFLMLSLPSTLFHLFASSFISSALEAWLASQKEQILKHSQEVASEYHRHLKTLMELQGAVLERAFLNQPQEILNNPSSIDDALDAELVEGIMFYDGQHRLLYQSLLTTKARKYWKPLSDFDWEQIEERRQNWLVEDLGNRLIYRHVRMVNWDNERIFLEIFYPATKHASFALDELEEQGNNLQVFAESQNIIKRYYLVIFLFMTALVVFAATWLAFYLARGFVQPIANLAEATQKVSQGELGYQVIKNPEMPLDRDFSNLVNAFNAMSQQLWENQLELEKTTQHLQQSHQTLEAHNRFVELVLEHIQTGVMSLDMEGRINGINRAAKLLLQIKASSVIGKHYRQVLEREPLDIFEEMLEDIRTQPRKAIFRDMTMIQNKSPVHIAATLLMIENLAGEWVGMVAVYDNITEIQRAQRARAWRDVARRIAHEIKNPLTPIQLSAQRIRRKYLEQVSDNQVLDEATQTIIEEVEQLKKMVMEFSSFARLPESNPQPHDLNATIEEAILLYRNALPEGIQLNAELDASLPRFPLDREQMKRVFINLIDNAIAAIGQQGRILIRSEYDQELKMVKAEVIDNGPGVAPEILRRLFEPYATTKKHGTGLGLTIVAQIISDHHGFIRHRNAEAGGSCFSVELPVS